MRTSTMMMVATLAVAGCSSGGGDAIKRVSADGTTQGIATDGDQHVAYLLNAPASLGSKGELHLASADGKDTKIATGISVGGYLLSPRGKGMVYAQSNAAGDEAALFWVDLANPAQAPKQLFDRGLQTQPVTPGGTTPTYTLPLTSQGFLTPSGRFYVVGVLPPNVSVSADLHVIDLDTGTDVFQRDNGGFDYLEVALPDDTLIFQDAVGNNSGPGAPPGVQTLFWVGLGGGAAQATTIDTRTGQLIPSGDNKTLVYQKVDTRELYSWDVVGKPASGTKIASNALTFAVGNSGPVAYIGTDHSIHVVGFDGKEIVAVDGATAKADFLSPVYLSGDGADVYWFQTVDTEDARGTLMHVGATAGAAPVKVADSASINDVRPVPGALLYLANVDGTGTAGDAFKSARDGSGAMPLGTGVPVGFLSIVTPEGGGATWLSPHLTMATDDKNKRLADGIRAIVGALELTSASGNAVVDPTVRVGQFTISDDLSTLAYVSGSAFDMTVDNYVGALQSAAVATPTMKQPKPILAGVSEIGVVTKAKQMFVNAPKASPAGVYFVKLP